MEILDEVDIDIPEILPHDAIYAIQIGYKLFKVSGASLLSDAPSYFTQFFGEAENADKVLFIDRSPHIFEKIYMHLQGYHIIIETESEFVHTWQDSHYFCLKRLQKVLNDGPMIANVGGKMFKIPRHLVSLPGNYPNFFLVMWENMTNDIKLLKSKMPLTRPPPQRATFQANRSPILFSDVLELLWGNYLVIRDTEHRELLTKECRYYRFLQLEQIILSHKILRDPFMQKEEILLGLNSIVQGGLTNLSTGFTDERPILYARPYIKNEPQRPLLVQIDSRPDSDVKLIINRRLSENFAVFTNRVASKICQIFPELKRDYEDKESRKLCIPCKLEDANVTINSIILKRDWFRDFYDNTDSPPAGKRQRADSADSEMPTGDFADFKIIKSVWRVMFRAEKAILFCVSLQAVSDQYHLNQQMTFL